MSRSLIDGRKACLLQAKAFERAGFAQRVAGSQESRGVLGIACVGCQPRQPFDPIACPLLETGLLLLYERVTIELGGFPRVAQCLLGRGKRQGSSE